MSSINRFKEHRLARAWSQEQLAEMAGLSTRTVQRIENGERPGLETLSALAAVFEVNVADLTGPQNGEDQALDQRIVDARSRLLDEARFYRSLITAVVVCGLLFVLNHVTAPDDHWSLWVAAIWGAVLFVRALRTFVFHGLTQRWQQKRLQKMLRR
ncbi:helix-turn-helix domain-containing protein [Pantoea agglomerans]|uniref:helix-turn-helix domain-containing protein n=2 Tax=Enterobacter agglomerans TaxID=549 RepID=UPI001A91961B|nr:helix-turn-helix domain-containing protein [Pantoea agglomerans]MBO0638704.1 helix-turn-helix domain-containing protein [Pantoea agglomerans]